MGDLLALAGLALLDSTSLGTLVIPLVLVIARRRVDVGPLSIYFATVVVIYYGLGVGIALGFDMLSDTASQVWSSRPAQWFKLVAGLALFGYGLLAPDPVKREESRKAPTRLSPGTMIALGAGAALTEAATMVPYLAANGIITAMPVGWPVRLALLAGYCLVMILPALVLIAAAAMLGERLWPRLERLVPTLERQTKITLLWVASLAGLWMAGTGFSELDL
ncbi:GAP family protein [Kocuria varians]|nr:GAP family protein [Kocuria varians]